MKTMGFADLRLCKPLCLDRAEAERLAVHAEDVLEAAAVVNHLRDAVMDCGLVAGFTRRHGKWRKYHYYTPREFAELVRSRGHRRVAVLFGNEASGLTDAELRHCNVAVTIPGSPSAPSLNLSHAVQVALYELQVILQGPAIPIERTTLANSDLESLCGAIADALAEIGFFHVVPPEDLTRFFRDIFARAGISTGEAVRLRSVFTKIAGIIRGRSQGSDR
jgi:TrmH family RNA methyltransferase